MPSLKFKLPWPPSINEYYTPFRHGERCGALGRGPYAAFEIAHPRQPGEVVLGCEAQGPLHGVERTRQGARSHGRSIRPRVLPRYDERPWISCRDRTPMEAVWRARMPPTAARIAASVVKYGTPRWMAARRME